MSARQHWAILGGGMLGLTLAFRLAQRGQSVSLFEAAGQWGGLASCWSLDGVVWDRFYHVVLASDSNLRGLLAEIGIEAELRWTRTKTGFWDGQRFYPMSSALDYLRFPPLNALDKARLAVTILQSSRRTDWQELEKIAVEDYLRRWSGGRTWESLWRPLLVAKLGNSYSRTSAAFIWAVIRRLYAARRSGLKEELFGYMPGGYARILAVLAEKLADSGVEMNLRHPARAVRRGPGSRLTVEFANAHSGAFDRVVVTLPSTAVAALCPDLPLEEREAFSRVEYVGVVCASVLLRRPLTDYYLTYITQADAGLTGVIEMSNLTGRAELGGNSLVYLPRYVEAGDALLEASDEEIRHELLARLERMHPAFRPDVLAVQVARARQVFALPVLHYSRLLPPMRTSVAGLHVVNSSYILNGTLNVNETVGLAETYAASY
jgi:protoporphyrinogen oxidase